ATAIGRGGEMRTAAGALRFAPTRAYAEIAGPDVATLPIEIPSGGSSNSIASFGEQMFLKTYRRLRKGVNPEVEIGRYLTEVAHFPNCVPLAGVAEHVDKDGTVTTLALLQA